MTGQTSSVSQTLQKARTLAKKGDREKATELYGAVLERFPSNEKAKAGLQWLQQAIPAAPEAGPSREQLGGLIGLFNQGRLQEALAQGNALANTFPNVPLIANLRGAILAAAGKSSAAIDSYRRAVELKPDYADAYNNLGTTLAGLGQYQEAMESFAAAVKHLPDFTQAHNNLGNVLVELNQPADAVASYQRALKFNPNYAEAHNNLGAARLAQDRFEDALENFNEAVRIQPNYAQAHNNLGIALNRLKGPDASVPAFSRAVQLVPNYAEAHNNLGSAFRDKGANGEAISCIEKAIEIRPDYPEAHNNLGVALRHDNRHEEAIASYHRALELRPEYVEAHNNLAKLLADTGRNGEARTHYLRIIEINPGYAEAHRGLTNMRKYEAGDPHITQLQRLLDDPGLSDENRMHLSFALGKVCNDLGDLDAAFEQIATANRLRKQKFGYDPDQDRKLFARLKAAAGADAPMLDQPEPHGATGHVQPIFILGMPRSGTTLTEQILASHSAVQGAGELETLSKAVVPLINGPIADAGGFLSEDQLETVRQSYLAGLEKVSAGKQIVTDKMPYNFQWIGIIRAALPEAKIIHLRRDARAICWSIFQNYFANQGNGYAYDLEDVAGYYRLYIDLMDFWRQRFPNQIYDLDYETLTENHEAETRRLLDHCGLPWEDQCLNFHKTDRVVATVSSSQVRQKMYQGSSEAWRRYETHLGPMIDALKGY